jgi:hypothetical protein
MKGRVKPKRLRSESTEWSGKLARLVTKDQIMVLLPFRRPGRTPASPAADGALEIHVPTAQTLTKTPLLDRGLVYT